MKKLIACLLAMVMLLGAIPMNAICVQAAQLEEVTEVPVEEAPVEEAPVEEAPVEEAPVEEVPVEEVPVEEVPVEEVPVEEAPAEEVPVEEVPVEEVPVEEAPVEEVPVEEVPVEEVPVEEILVEEVAVEDVAAEDVAAEEEEYTVTCITLNPEIDLPDNDELFAGYVKQVLYGKRLPTQSIAANLGVDAGKRLSGNAKVMYDALVPLIKEIAAGKRASTEIGIGQTVTASDGVTYIADAPGTFTGSQLYSDEMLNMIFALLSDLPYEQYWFDKTTGWSIGWIGNSTKIVNVQIAFSVADNYQGSGEFVVNTTKAKAAAATAAKAKDIVSKYAGVSDYNKLVGYKNEICRLVEYDYDAVYYGDYAIDDDPWQLIHTFDGDSSTNIVCEGYAKSFMYLCDLSKFNGDVTCYTVSGDAGGAHMWNIVNIGGKNYHTDITWIDGGASGLFLAGGSGSPTSGYTFPEGTYVFDVNTQNLWGTGSSSILKLSSTDYVPVNELTAPTLSVSNVASTGKIKLTWNAIADAKEYKVYRATSKTGTYSLLKTTTGTSLTNTSAVAGKTYYYKVKAIHSDSARNSGFSNIVNRTCDLPRPVVKLSNVASTGKIKLTWDAIDGAASYKVYRATSASGSYTLLKNTTGTSLTNTSTTAGTKYYYKVYAVHESNSSANSAYSAVVNRTCDLARPVAKVALSSNKPVVSWAKIDGAVKYTVYIYDADGSLIKSVSTTGLKLNHSSAVKGTTYKYRVVAVASNTAANSAKSSTVSITSK